MESTDARTKEQVEAFEKKLDAVAGSQGGFFAPPSPETTLSRVNSQAGTLYQQIWQTDAEPTGAQSEAAAATEKDGADVLKRWKELKSSDLPALNQMLRESKVPEINPEEKTNTEQLDMDEE